MKNKITTNRLVIAAMAATALTLIATTSNPTCYDAVPTGPCQQAGTWVQSITCRVNCSICPYTARDNQICLRTITRTNQIFASTQHNWGCTNGTTYVDCTTTTFNGCQYEREVMVCETWPTTACLPKLTREWAPPGPRTGVTTPQVCPTNAPAQ